jgi:hypothetical protein
MHTISRFSPKANPDAAIIAAHIAASERVVIAPATSERAECVRYVKRDTESAMVAAHGLGRILFRAFPYLTVNGLAKRTRCAVTSREEQDAFIAGYLGEKRRASLHA